MSFDVAAESYDGFMGRYSRLLAPQLADLAGVRAGQRALDVGSGPGALTAELVTRLGAGAVTAVEPSAPFVAAAQARHPGVEVVQASAEAAAVPGRLVRRRARPARRPLHDRSGRRVDGDAAGDPTGRRRRRLRLGSRRRPRPAERVLAASLVRSTPSVDDESNLAGVREGHLAELFAAAGLHAIEPAVLSISVEHPTFDAWWEPFTHGVGPAGSYVAGLDADRRAELREACRAALPLAPFTLTARAWAARGIA